MFGAKACKGSGCSATIWTSGDLCPACAGAPNVRVCTQCGYLMADLFMAVCNPCHVARIARVRLACLQAFVRLTGKRVRVFEGERATLWAVVPRNYGAIVPYSVRMERAFRPKQLHMIRLDQWTWEQATAQRLLVVTRLGSPQVDAGALTK